MAGRKRQLPRGVKIRQYANSEAIQIAFTYKGIECRETLKLPATAGNLRYAANLRHEILAEIERGTFNYQEKFPESRRAAKFGFQTRRRGLRCKQSRTVIQKHIERDSAINTASYSHADFLSLS